MVSLPSPDLLRNQGVRTEFDVRSAPLGNGYERVARGGRNNSRDIVRVRWALLTASDAETLFNTIKNTGGVDTITFTLADQSTSTSYRVLSLSRDYNDTLNEYVEAELRQIFTP